MSVQGRRVMNLLRARARNDGQTVLVVTHDPRVREFADRVLEMEDGVSMRSVMHAHLDSADVYRGALRHFPFQLELKRRVAGPRREIIR